MKNNFRKLLDSRRKDYKKFKPVFCPCVKENVNFNSDGFYHLRHEVSGRERSIKEQMYKLGLLPLVVSVIKTAKTIDKYYKVKVPVSRKKIKGKREIKEVEYWGITAFVGKQKSKIKVVLRKVGNGQIHFWSVMKYERAINKNTRKK